MLLPSKVYITCDSLRLLRNESMFLRVLACFALSLPRSGGGVGMTVIRRGDLFDDI